MSIRLLMAFAAAAASTVVSARVFEDGERVCFFGDSVTHWNCGTGGATVGVQVTRGEV